MQATSFQLPDLYRDLPSWMEDEKHVAVEHAALHARTLEVGLAYSLSRRGDVLLVTPDPSRVSYLVFQWGLTKSLKKTRLADLVVYSNQRVKVWVSDGEEVKDLPFRGDQLQSIVIVDAHRIRVDAYTSLQRFLGSHSCFLAFGELSSRHHWFYRFGRNGATLHQLDSACVCDSFPDQSIVNAQSKGTPDYDRRFRLLDVEQEHKTPFLKFTRTRLKVRTEKGREFLTPRQQHEAQLQLGKNWYGKNAGVPVVSFDVSKLQRRYLAHKRAGYKRGYSKFILLKYRRGGFTTIEQAQSYQLTSSNPQSLAVTLAHDMESTKRIFRIARLFHENDPHAPQRSNDSKTSLEFTNGSYFFIGTAGSKAFSRGDSLQRVHGSEVAYWSIGPNQYTNQEMLVAGLTEACSHGEMVFESTPNGKEWFQYTYNEAKKGQNDWFPIFLRWFDDPTNIAQPGTYSEEEILDTLVEDEKSLIQRYGLSLAQIAFRRAKKRSLKRLFPQEYPEDDQECFLTSGVCFFDSQVLSAVIKLLPEVKTAPVYRELKGGYWVEWEPPKKGVTYCLGGDTSEGIPGCDYNGVGVIRKDNGKQVAATHGRFSIRDQSLLAIQMSKRYNGALIGIERNNHGHAVLERIIEEGYGRPHFQGGPLYYFDRKSKTKTSRPGWDTNPVTRPMMLDDLAEMFEVPDWIRDKTFVEECLGFVQQPSGKFEGSPYDDAVMKWAIAFQMRKYRRVKPGLDFVEGGP